MKMCLMALIKYFLLISLIFFKIIMIKCSDINMTMYYTFPPLYEYEDYDRCLYENPAKISAYCLTDIELIPNNQSELWKNIKEFSEDKLRHFRHDSMIYAICVNWCENKLKGLNNRERDGFYGGLLLNKQLVEYNADLYEKETENRINYNKIINECLNFKFRTKYNLSVTSNIKYCNTNRDKMDFDWWDFSFIIVTIALIILNILSTLYDLILKKRLPPTLQTNEHYKELIKNSRQQICLSFSICRNYFRLTRKTYDLSNHAKELRFIDTFKFFMMLGVVSSHLMMFQIAAGLENTDHLERFLHRVDKNILINSSGLMQCFFQISGFLVLIGFDDLISKMKKDQIRYLPLFFKMVFLRYVRLVPLVAYGVLFSSSIMTKLGNGPLWRFASEREKIFCRRNWWINILFLQNYINVQKSCMPQSWYIAVDLQSFVVGSILIILSYKYPHRTKIIFIVPLIVALISPAITVLLYDVTGLYFHAPEYFRHFVYFNEGFIKMYIPLQNNLMGYLSGIVTGKLYLHLKSINFNLSQNKLRIFLWYFMILLGFLIIFSGEIYYRYNVPKSISAIHGGLYKLIYALLFAYIIIGITDKIGWMAYDFSNLFIFRVLGRLTYAVLVVQIYVILTVFSIIRKPQFQNDIRLILYILGMNVLSYVTAFIITIVFELPITALLKIVFGKPNSKIIGTKKKLLNDQTEMPEPNQINLKEEACF